MEQSLSLLRSEMRVLVRQDKLDRVEEVGFAGAVTADDDVVALNERHWHIFAKLFKTLECSGK